MSAVDEQGRAEPPIDADELTTVLGYLDYHRATFEWKCSGLDSAGLRATVGASAMTLGGMMKHLALVEDDWFGRWLLGGTAGEPWDSVDWKADRDWDWHSAADDSPADLLALWRGSVERSRQRLAEVLADGGLDQPCRKAWPDGRSPSVRWVLVHMVEEYARHNGHADLLREAVDGVTGE